MGKPQLEYECDSCCQAMSGYTRRDLEADSWVWHTVLTKEKGKFHPVECVFVMCGVCEEMYAERRKVRN